MARARRPSESDRITMISLTGFTTTALSAAGLLLLVFSSFLLQAHQGGASSSSSDGSTSSYVPVRRVVYRSMSPAAVAAMTTTTAAAESSAAAYEPFEVCEGCKCCASPSNASSCVETNCCYAINCNLPGKPFGTCAFTPQSCGCGGDGNCTQSSS